MSAKQEVRILFLFDDEVRIAAKAVARFVDLAEAETRDEDAISEAAMAALRAVAVALAGADDDGMAIMLASRSALERKNSVAAP